MAKTLHIVVADKIATYAAGGGYIVCGNGDYEVAFTFDAEWDNHPVKTARFAANGKHIDVVFEGATVTVPKLYNTTQVSVGVFSGELKTSTSAVIRCLPGATCEGGVPEEPTPDVYGQLVDLINNGLGGGGGGASWPKPEQVTADTRITEAGYYYAYAGFTGVGAVTYNFGVFYCDPTKVTLGSTVSAYIHAGHLARLTISTDGKVTLQIAAQTVSGTNVTTTYTDNNMYSVYLAKLS